MSPFKPKVNPFTIICFCSLSSFTYASPSWVFIFFFSPILWSQHINLITRQTFFKNPILSFFSHPTPLLCPALCPALLCSLSLALKKKSNFILKTQFSSHTLLAITHFFLPSTQLLGNGLHSPTPHPYLPFIPWI